MRSIVHKLSILWPVLLLLTVAAQSSPAQVRPEFSIYEVETDSTTTVTFFLEDASDVYALDFLASYDPALLEIVDADPGSDGIQVQPGLFPQPDFVAMQDVDIQAGTIRYVVTQVNPTLPANGDGLLFAIRLRGKGNAGETSLHIERVEMANRAGELLPVQWVHAALQVAGRSAAEPVIVPTRTTPEPTAVPQTRQATAEPLQKESNSAQDLPAAVETIEPPASATMTPTNPVQTVPATSPPDDPQPAVLEATAVNPADDPPSGPPPTISKASRSDKSPDPEAAAPGSDTTAVAGTALIDTPSEGAKSSTPDQGEPGEEIAVIGADVPLEAPSQLLTTGEDRSSSAPIGLLSLIVVALVGAVVVFLLVRRSGGSAKKP